MTFQEAFEKLKWVAENYINSSFNSNRISIHKDREGNYYLSGAGYSVRRSIFDTPVCELDGFPGEMVIDVNGNEYHLYSRPAGLKTGSWTVFGHHPNRTEIIAESLKSLEAV